LSDAPALQQLNEKGEYHRANLTDMNTNYSLQTFGEIVAITRKVIINDDLQAFTRIPAILGVAAAQLESNTVWGSSPAIRCDDARQGNRDVPYRSQQPAQRRGQQHRSHRGYFRSADRAGQGPRAPCGSRRLRRALR
jgi:hypothetical protein